MKGFMKRPIRSNSSYFKVLEEAEHLEKIQARQIKKIPSRLSDEARARLIDAIFEAEVEKKLVH